MYCSYQSLQQEKPKLEDCNNWKILICQEIGRCKPLRSKGETKTVSPQKVPQQQQQITELITRKFLDTILVKVHHFLENKQNN